jgi:hypothetical protein
MYIKGVSFMKKANYTILQDLDTMYESSLDNDTKLKVVEARSKLIIADAINSIAVSLHNIEQKYTQNKWYSKRNKYNKGDYKVPKTEREDREDVSVI